MKKMSLTVLVAPIFLAQIQTLAWGGQNANISGKVFDSQGNPVSGVEILAADVNGQPRGRSLTNEQGEYVVTALEKGRYQLTLNPRASGLKGQTVVAALDQRGLEVAWTTSMSAPAIATANTPRNNNLQPTPSSANQEPSMEPLLAASTVAGSPATVPVGPSVQAVTAATMAGDTAGAVATTGQQEDSSRRRRGFFLGGLGLVGAGLGGAAADGAFDDDDDKDNVVSDSR